MKHNKMIKMDDFFDKIIFLKNLKKLKSLLRISILYVLFLHIFAGFSFILGLKELAIVIWLFAILSAFFHLVFLVEYRYECLKLVILQKLQNLRRNK